MRLIDLHTDWLLQYAGECTVYDAALYPGVRSRWPQGDGYLQATSAAIVSCFRRAADWSSQADPWSALDELIVRIEAEFAGKVLRDPVDIDRWRDDPEGLTWAVIGVEGFDALIRDTSHLDRLDTLVRRGVRLFQPSYTADNQLAGSSVEGDDRGLLDLGRQFLDRLASLSNPERGPRPILDLAHLNPSSMSEILAWFEADPDHRRRLIPAYSHGAPSHPGFSSPRAITPENLARLRGLGGTIGFGVTPPFYQRPDQIRAAIQATAAIPFHGRKSYEGIAIGTDFLGVDATLPGLGNAEAVSAWIEANFPRDAARAILFENATSLIESAIGVSTTA
jgi:membrane dipeptidase